MGRIKVLNFIGLDVLYVEWYVYHNVRGKQQYHRCVL